MCDLACIINNVIIEEVSGGIINFGDIFNISPISIEKGTIGSGGSNSGDQIYTKTNHCIINKSKCNA